MKRMFYHLPALVLLTGAMSLLPAGPPQKGAQPAVPASPGAQGHSIFNETMVDMTWPDVEKAARGGAVVLLATAVIEEHGPHMTCGTDTYLGYQMCRLVRRELEKSGTRAVIAPPFFWGINSSTQGFPGTFTARPETVKALLADIFGSLKAMGFGRVFIINSHGDGQHKKAVIQAIMDARKGLALDVRLMVAEESVRALGLTGPPPDWVLLHKMPPGDDKPGPEYVDVHAGAGETSMMAAFFPGLVDLPLARTLPSTKVTPAGIGEWLKDAKRVTPLGYLGDPAGYNIEEGRTYVLDWCRMMAEAIAGYAGAHR